MIRILTHDQQDQLVSNWDLSKLASAASDNFWLDISAATEEEREEVKHLFPEFDRQNKLVQKQPNRPQLKLFKDGYSVSMRVISPNTLKTHELYLYVSEQKLITFHRKNLKAINDVWHECRSDPQFQPEHIPEEILRRLMSRLIDQYIMAVNDLEDQIDELDLNAKNEPIHKLNRKVFQLRSQLLGFRRVIAPLMDVIHRIIGSAMIKTSRDQELFLRDINENLSRLTHMIESNLEITSDIRDSYLSLTTYRMNRIMQTLTVITTIFMPLTFIVGIYGMNFAYMPELDLQYGYFIVLGVMAVIALIMFYWFRKKGWFDK